MTMTVMPNMHASVCECICVPVLCVSRYVRVCMPVPGCGVCLALSLACPCGCVCACCERPARPAHSAWGSAQLARARAVSGEGASHSRPASSQAALTLLLGLFGLWLLSRLTSSTHT